MSLKTRGSAGLPAMELRPGRGVRTMPRTRAPKGASRASRARPMLPCPRMSTSLSCKSGKTLNLDTLNPKRRLAPCRLKARGTLVQYLQ